MIIIVMKDDIHNYIYGYDYQDDSHDDQCS